MFSIVLYYVFNHIHIITSIVLLLIINCYYYAFIFYQLGTTDMHRQFHPISLSICSNETATDFEFIFVSIRKVVNALFTQDYKPSILMADGADAITNGFLLAFDYESVDDCVRLMCWAHVFRAVDKKTESIDEPQRKNIRDDIDSLQIMPSPELFAMAYKLFVAKWSSEKNAAIDTFLAYFNKEWVVSRNCNWFEGAAICIPSTDNALESVNGVIKSIYTLREMLPVNQYIANAFAMLRDWSKVC